MADIEITSTGVSETDIYLNTVLQGQINPLNQIDVNLEDSLGNPVTPISSNLTGNTLDIVTYPAPSGVDFKFPLPSQYTSYATGDTGWRFQNGFYNITKPTHPKVIADIDYTAGSASWFRLKTGLTVNGVNSKTRFVDINGIQAFSSTGNANVAVIDKLTGLMFTRAYNPLGSNWATTLSNILSYSVTIKSIIYDDWYLMGMCDFLSIFGSGININSSIGFRDASTLVTLANFTANQFTSDTDNQSTNQAMNTNINGAGLIFSVSNKLNSNNGWGLVFRDARNLISE